MSAIDIDDALYRLRLYNEKVEKIQRTRFFQRIISGGKLSTTTKAGEDKPLTITLEGPDEDNIDAFITTYRLFIQPREKIDRQGMKEVYEALRDTFGFPADEVKLAIVALDSADDYFSQNTPMQINNDPLCRGKLHDVVIYGGFAHANRDKKEIYDSWVSSGFFPLIMFHFIAILLEVLPSILSFEGLNKRAIEYLDKKKATSAT